MLIFLSIITLLNNMSRDLKVEGKMVQSVVTRQYITLTPSQEILGGPKLIHVFYHGIVFYNILVHFLQVDGEL